MNASLAEAIGRVVQGGYVVAWERYYGRMTPKGHVIHHTDGDGSHADPLRLVAVPRGTHTGMHNRARVSGVLAWPEGWRVVRGVLVSGSGAGEGGRAGEVYPVRAAFPGVVQSAAHKVVGMARANDPDTVSAAVWQTREQYEAGLTELPDVEVPALPANAPACARAVYPGALLLARCRFLVFPNAPFAMSRVFMAKWCGVTEAVAQRGIAALVRLMCYQRDEDILARGRRCNSYLPVGIERVAGWVSNLLVDTSVPVPAILPTRRLPALFHNAVVRAVHDIEGATTVWARDVLAATFIARYGLDVSAHGGVRLARVTRGDTLTRHLARYLDAVSDAESCAVVRSDISHTTGTGNGQEPTQAGIYAQVRGWRFVRKRA